MESFSLAFSWRKGEEGGVINHASVLRQSPIPWRMIPSKISTLEKLRNPGVDQYPYT